MSNKLGPCLGAPESVNWWHALARSTNRDALRRIGMRPSPPHIEMSARVKSADRPDRRSPCAVRPRRFGRAERRVRARKLRQRRWRYVPGAADRRRRDRRPCPCPLRAGGLCAVRGKAPLLICSGAASRRGLSYGVQLGFMGVQLGGKVIWAGSRGPRLRCGNFRAAAGGCHPACQMMERRGADAAVRSWPAARFRLTAIIVSAGQVLGLVMRPGRRRRYSPAGCRPGRPLSCYLGLVIDHRFGDVPLEWVFKSPLGHPNAGNFP